MHARAPGQSERHADANENNRDDRSPNAAVDAAADSRKRVFQSGRTPCRRPA
jgi:hypothetical protein